MESKTTAEIENIELMKRCHDYEIELYETRIALYRLIKAFDATEKSPQQVKYHNQADSILRKYTKATDVLRNEALSAGQGKGEFGFDYKQRELERGKTAPEGAIKAMHERWRKTGERRECSDCGTWFESNGRCPECNPLG